MLEGLAAWVLNTYVGEYVENLNTDQLSIALLQGAVELDNLPFKKDALKFLDLPLEIKSGFIGKITLHIPVRRMRSEPWVISMEKLYLVAGPIKNTKYTKEEEKKKELDQKLAMLKDLEKTWQVQSSEKPEGAGSSWLSYGTSLASNILENLQLNVKEVHLRYEDEALIPSSPFACGVVIKSLSAQSTDGKWVPKFVSGGSEEMMRKLVDLKHFSIYLDTDAVMLGNLPQDKLKSALEVDKFQSHSSKAWQPHDYILSPVSAQAKMTRNTSPLPLSSPKTPRITLDMMLEQIPISLSEKQYRSLVLWLKEFERHDKQRKYRRWRPKCSIKKSPSAWWKFGFNVHQYQIKESKQRSTWKFVLQRAKDNVLYHKAYMQQLKQGYVDPKLKTQMTDMEEEMTFDELKILRELTYDKFIGQKKHEDERIGKKVKETSPTPPPPPPKPAPKQDSPDPSGGGGLFRGWFPGWGGWYSRGSPQETEEEAHKQTVGEPPTVPGIELEQEILDVIQNSSEDNTLLRRDAVFAVLNFCLKSGSFCLKSSQQTISGGKTTDQSILEMECTTISSTVVSRPRTGTLKFAVSVGGLYLRDRMTEGTIFNTLVAPQAKERSYGHSRPTLNINRPFSISSPGLSSLKTMNKANDDGKIFQMSWERKPLGTTADYRLSVQTKPLDIIYNPTAARRVTDFFSRPTKLGLTSKTSELSLTAAARTRYENLKEQTKAELRQTLDSLLEGEGKQTKRWEVNLDIRAPQFIIPENFTDPNTTMVVLDLGNLRFHNTELQQQQQQAESPDEDSLSEDNTEDFLTPLSTSPSDMEIDKDEEGVADLSQLSENLSESAFRERLYEKYTLELSDLQVLVGKAKDNWRHAHYKGTSHLHVIDRFSISLLLERRLLYTTDPQWPSATLSGTLPSLTVHINEQKVQALQACGGLLTGDGVSSPSSTEHIDGGESPIKSTQGSQTNRSSSTVEVESSGREQEEQSRLLMMQFTVNQASLQIQSLGKAIAELQVGGVRANLTQRAHASSLSFTIHSLLVVDAVQTFGPDFELLVASHKNLCLDSRSGSMRDSDPNSPVSPKSPQSPREHSQPPFSTPSNLHAVQTVLTNAFQALIPSPGSSDTSIGPVPQTLKRGYPGLLPDDEALITLDIEILRPESSGDSGLQIANIQFNNLDVIANQETIVEILGFFKRIMPAENVLVDKTSESSSSEPDHQEIATVNKTRTEVTADFNRLNILLMRVVDDRCDKKAKKIATATLSSAKIQATIDEELYVEGSLGGLQFLDVTPEGVRYQKVFSVGHDPNPHDSFHFTAMPSRDMFRTTHEAFTRSMFEPGLRAFTFTLKKGALDSGPNDTSHDASDEFHAHSSPIHNKSCPEQRVSPNMLDINLKMASLCYTHCPRLLNELSQSASEFQDYMAKLASSLRYAATELALGIVHKRADLNSSSFYGGSVSSLDSLPLGNFKMDSLNKEPETAVPLHIVIDAMLETPVIVLPRTPSSSEALVAHLGNITIRNTQPQADQSLLYSKDEENKDRIYIEFRNMNLYSVNIDHHTSSHSTKLSESLSGSKVADSDSIPIIYDTTIELTIDSIDPDFTIVNPDFNLDEDILPPTQHSIHIENTQCVVMVKSCIATPLNVVISKRAFEQVLESMDNLTYIETSQVSPEPRKLDIIQEELPHLEPSMSALKLDGVQLGPTTKQTFQEQLDETREGNKPFLVKVRFDVPELNIEMRGDFDEGEQGLVQLKLQEFSMDLEKDNVSTTESHLTLKSLVIEDLLQNPESKHRLLMVSTVPGQDEGQMKPKPFLSTSCPDSTIIIPTPVMPSSLPNSFHEHQQNVFLTHQQKSKPLNIGLSSGLGKKTQREDCPLTPPPSPFGSRRRSLEDSKNSALVHIYVKLIDKNSTEYITEFNKTNRFVSIDFNGLDTTINLQTWVVLLDFLGLGAKIHETNKTTVNKESTEESPATTLPDDVSGPVETTEETINTEVELNVNSLSLTLNKPEYELAKANISGLQAQLSIRDNNVTVRGELGSVSLRDQSPHGKIYREKFMTVGQHALHFHFFKYGLPDPELKREFDLSLKLRTASVRYLHTNRFQAETLAFCQHFLQLQDVLGRMRAASAGKKVSDAASIGSRIQLDVQADAPVILVPHSSQSTDVLVMDLGNLTLTNTFLFDGELGTIKCQSMPATESSSRVLSPSDMVRILSKPTPQNLLSGNLFAQGMTQSSFDQCFPPSSNSDPMLQSIYGSLDQDYRSDESSVSFDTGSVYDPTDLPGQSASSGSQSQGTVPRLSQSSSMTDGSSAMSAHQRRALNQSMESLSTSQRFESAESLQLSHVCLLDVMTILLSDMDLYSAEAVNKHTYEGNLASDLEFPSCVIKRVGGNLLREKCVLNLQVERNLEGDISHSVPDFCVKGSLTSVQFSLDLTQYSLVRGILDHNLGELLEEFQRPLMSHLQDPKIQTLLSGTVWKCISMTIDLNNVTVELLKSHKIQSGINEDSLAKFGFIRSRLSYDSYSDQSRDVDLVSHEIIATDTRFGDVPKNKRSNVFTNILQPSKHGISSSSMQMELHFRSTKEFSRFTVLLNNMRVMCIIDWLLSIQTFLLTTAENPFQNVDAGRHEQMQTPTRSKSAHEMSAPTHARKSKSPLTVSGGIITKRGPYIEEVQVPFEMKLNVTDTEFIVVEDMTTCDTNAVILKCTAVVSFKPKSNDKPLSCSLQSLEVFSCCLEAEEDTALSIIDPMTISIDLNANPLPIPRKSASAGLLDATKDLETPLLLEVSFNTMNIRLSYHDFKLFLSILNSLPNQADQAKAPHTSRQVFTDQKIQHLVDLGFTPSDCERALAANQGSITDAAIWLTLNAAPQPMKMLPEKNTDHLDVTAMELKATSICVCLIDDCQDADVPLAEISLNGTTFHQSFDGGLHGKAMFQLVGDYYNRALSGWEPFIEPWRSHVNWNKTDDLLDVTVSASEVLNFNLTSALIDQYNKTKGIWTEDYYKYTDTTGNNSPTGSSSSLSDSGCTAVYQKRRVPFVPFTLKNETGSTLWFLTVTTTPSMVSSGNNPQRLDEAYIQATSWRMVTAGQLVPFFIQDREKMRHKKSHELCVHQLVVKVDGWQRVSPVSVDKVGIYFRHAQPEYKSPFRQGVELPPARVVFDVQQDGSAKKLVVVRSALVMVNQLPSPVTVKMENTLTNETGFSLLDINISSKVAIPLKHVSSRLWVKPRDVPVDYCDRAIHWHHVMKAGDVHNGIRKCHPTDNNNTSYRFCVAVKRENYPEDVKKSSNQGSVHILPGHTIILVPTIVVANLLPVEFTYHMKSTDISGTVKPGEEAALLTAELSQHLEFGVQMENFSVMKYLYIPPGTTHYKVKQRLKDPRDRILELVIRLSAQKGGSLKLSVSAPYWLVNRSGLPLIFKQDFSSQAAAGQYEEHELARSVTPLLFSYPEKEYPFLCTMRVGTSVHGVDGKSSWSDRFSLESGTGVRQLYVMYRPSNRPAWLVTAQLAATFLLPSQLSGDKRLQVYNIGIHVRQGRAQYRDTNIVTFAPRFEIDNLSRHKLAISQRHLAKGQQDSEAFLLAFPNCKLPYHWPRLDLDQLLCIKLADQPNCMWTGGFTIDQVNSFHLILRDMDDGSSMLLKVEVLLEGPTFHVVFTDSEQLPPPFRIDNFSEVPIQFHQSKVTNENLRIFVREHSTFNYTWDEPTLPPHISVMVQGGTSAIYNMDVLREGEQLCYQNFIYLAATATFRISYMGSKGIRGDVPAGLVDKELVLDVQHNNHVVFRKKEQGKRSQLWRMSSKGMLEHEGSAPPRDPRKPSKSGTSLVLDIADIGAQPDKMVPLMLKKPDERRRSTQTWSFSQDGRLCCSLGDLTVQAISGVGGLQDGAIAVIGPFPEKNSPAPLHMLISRQRLRPGSGCLSVNIRMDGPTRVLQITDIGAIKKSAQWSFDGDWELCGDEAPKMVEKKQSEKPPRNLQLSLSLKGGLGISLVNQCLEELIYISLQDIQVDYSSKPTDITVTATVSNIQIDNQLLDSQREVMLFVTPHTRRDVMDNTPALHLTAHKVPNNQWNAEIFRHLIISMKKLTTQLEEKLLWKLLQFVGYNQPDPELKQLEESEIGSHKLVMAATSVQARRYYFGTFKININRLTLSMITANKLPADLQTVKMSMSIPLVKFEEAKVDLDPFVRFHPFETPTFLFNEMTHHYTEELKSQAAKILGSVDFLGNPLGLFNDMAEGISGLIKDGNVEGLFKNVTHGFSNTAAKLTGSLSDGVGTVTMDEKHNATRELIKGQHGNSGGGHLVAGIKGLGYGIFGGLTSIVSQTYEGTKEDGLEGFFTGLGKGVVGTVTKPIAGVLDFTSETASAVRDTSKNRSRYLPGRTRQRRCCHGNGGLLVVYSKYHAENQMFLYSLNDNNFSEFYVAMEQLRSSNDDCLRALITNMQVYFLKKGPPLADNVVFRAKYSELQNCKSLSREQDGQLRYYVELMMNTSSPIASSRRHPQVRCDKDNIAQKVAQQIMYAKTLYDERKHTLITDDLIDELDQ